MPVNTVNGGNSFGTQPPNREVRPTTTSSDNKRVVEAKVNKDIAPGNNANTNIKDVPKGANIDVRA